MNTTATSTARWAVAALGAAACSRTGKTEASRASAGQADASLPQLGQASLPDVLAALTSEEKVKLVVGLGLYPAGFPAGILPPGDPGDEKVPGVAGRTHAIARLGIPSLTLSDGPAGALPPSEARTQSEPTTPRLATDRSS